MTDPIRAALERLIARLDETTDPSGPVPAWSDSFYAARAALAKSEPAGPSDIELLSMAGDAVGYEIALGEYEPETECAVEAYGSELIDFARAVLARFGNHPAPPAEGEVGWLVELLRFEANTDDAIDHTHWLTADQMHRAADLLEQRHPTPVPVSERLPGPEDCDAKGRVWWGAPALSGTVTGSVPHSWRLCRPEDRFGSELVWLPAAALPLPAAEVQQ